MAANKPVFPASPHSPQSQPGRLQATTERELGKVITDVRKMRDGRLSGYFALPSVPTGGTFAQGDVVRNADPSLTLSGTDQYFIWGWCYASEGSGTLTWAPIKIWTAEVGAASPFLATSVTATNIGASGQGLYSGNPSGELQFRKIKSGSTGNVTISTSGNEIVIDLNAAPFVASSMTATNAGTGSGLYINNNAGVLSFRTLKAAGGLTISTSGSEVVISGYSFTAGSIPFAGSDGLLSVTSSVFRYDATNVRLGIGAAPNVEIEARKGVGSGGGVLIRADNTNVAGYAGFQIFHNGAEGAVFTGTGASFTAAGTVFTQNRTFLYSAQTDGLWIGSHNSTAGDIVFYTGGTAATNERGRVFANGNVRLGAGSLTVSSSFGFLHIPSVAGVPVAAPVTYTGYAPICFDRTNNRIYVYNAGWKQVTVA